MEDGKGGGGYIFIGNRDRLEVCDIPRTLYLSHLVQWVLGRKEKQTRTALAAEEAAQADLSGDQRNAQPTETASWRVAAAPAK